MTKRVNKLIVLGSGTSTGIPVLGCHCSTCTHDDPKNKRLRSSIFLKTAQGQHLLVDSGPDLRTQLLREKIERVDGLILTHFHADHCYGIDDLRPLSFAQQKAERPEGIPVYADPDNAKIINEKFFYLFKNGPKFNRPWAPGVARLYLEELPLSALEREEKKCAGDEDKTQSFDIYDDTFEFFLNPHGAIKTLSFIHGKMAYIIDCHEIAPPLLARLREDPPDLLIIDCVRIHPHNSHLHLSKTLEYVQDILPKRCGLIHLGHDFEHNEFSKQLQKNFSGRVFPLYDGQVLSYPV